MAATTERQAETPGGNMPNRTITEIEADREANLKADRHADPANMTQAERNSEAAEILEQLAPHTTELDERGYMEGIAAGMRDGTRHASPDYLERLRARRTARLEATDEANRADEEVSQAQRDYRLELGAEQAAEAAGALRAAGEISLAESIEGDLERAGLDAAALRGKR